MLNKGRIKMKEGARKGYNNDRHTWSISPKASSGAILKPPFPKPSRWDNTTQFWIHKEH